MAVRASHSLAESLAASGRVVGSVIAGASLDTALAESAIEPPALRAAAQDLAYNTLREFGFVDTALARLLRRPARSAPLHGLLLAALTELAARPRHAHATVHQAVEAAALIGQPRAKILINAVLREFQRREPALRREIESSEPGRYRHPQWWIEELRAAYPDRWEGILLAANAHPPMILRVNLRRATIEHCLALMARSGIGARHLGGQALLLEAPRPVVSLPGFAEGLLSVQDLGAQRAAPLLDARPGMRVLDACAAPGGKAAHLLEIADLELTALDLSAERLVRLRKNLTRLGLSARIVAGDALAALELCEGRPFDRILLDAPCSASGVVRRHPDIRWLRRAGDIDSFARVQRELLDAQWQALAPGGKLLYATCSVFPRENELQVHAFLGRHADARRLRLSGLEDGQILPDAETDGFFYAMLKKQK